MVDDSPRSRRSVLRTGAAATAAALSVPVVGTAGASHDTYTIEVELVGGSRATFHAFAYAGGEVEMVAGQYGGTMHSTSDMIGVDARLDDGFFGWWANDYAAFEYDPDCPFDWRENLRVSEYPSNVVARIDGTEIPHDHEGSIDRTC